MPHERLSTSRLLWASASFLLGFAALIWIVARWWLVPATAAMAQADDAGRSTIAAYGTLLMVLVLIISLVGLFLAFRVHRFFVRPDPPGKSPPIRRGPSQAVDVKPFQK